MVGTPPVTVTFSRSISAIASTASHLRIITSLLPVIIVLISEALQAVTWKSGITVSAMRGRDGGGSSPRRRQDRCVLNALARLPVSALRCVPSAPLGAPVVPLV